MITEKPDTVTEYSDKQVQIVLAAERLFAEHGFEGTSVRDIAQEAGVNVAMISYYFGSKEKLLQALFNYRIAASRLVLEHLLSDKDMSPLDKIDALIDGMVNRMVENKTFHRVMLQCQITTEGEEIDKLIAGTKLKNLELVNKIIAEGQRKKVFVKGIDTAMLMMTVTGTIYQAAAGSTYLRLAHPEAAGTETEYADLLKKKLKAHLKRVVKATLTYEGK